MTVNGAQLPQMKTAQVEKHFRQIIFSQLYLRARTARDGSITPPRRRSTKWSVDSYPHCTHGQSAGLPLSRHLNIMSGDTAPHGMQ